ncbi:protein iolH, partial [Salmonella enterica subsp. enterica serovar Typhimurium]
KGQVDVARMLNFAGADLSLVLLADTHYHSLLSRYIMKPPGVIATIHQLIGLGEAEADFDALFQALREMVFANRTFK